VLSVASGYGHRLQEAFRQADLVSQLYKSGAASVIDRVAAVDRDFDLGRVLLRFTCRVLLLGRDLDAEALLGQHSSRLHRLLRVAADLAVYAAPACAHPES
jgi:hypothetical protein